MSLEYFRGLVRPVWEEQPTAAALFVVADIVFFFIIDQKYRRYVVRFQEEGEREE